MPEPVETRYDPEEYWSSVAAQIGKRSAGAELAGEENPFFAYKRAKCHQRFLATLDVGGKSVLEVGCGPGSNLVFLGNSRNPRQLHGVDISSHMVDLARGNVSRCVPAIDIRKIDGQHLPFADLEFDLSFTVTVLQHITDDDALASLAAEMARVTRRSIVIMEEVARRERRRFSAIRRSRDQYCEFFAARGFILKAARPLEVGASQWWYDWVRRRYRRRFPDHQEGQPIAPLARRAIGLLLPVTKHLDRFLSEGEGLECLTFLREPAP